MNESKNPLALLGAGIAIGVVLMTIFIPMLGGRLTKLNLFGAEIELPTASPAPTVLVQVNHPSNTEQTPIATLPKELAIISQYLLPIDQPFTEDGIMVNIYDWRVTEPELAHARFSITNQTQKDILLSFDASQVTAYDGQGNPLELITHQRLGYIGYCASINKILKHGETYECSFQVKADFSIVSEIIVVIKDLPRFPHVDWMIPIDLR